MEGNSAGELGRSSWAGGGPRRIESEGGGEGEKETGAGEKKTKHEGRGIKT